MRTLERLSFSAWRSAFRPAMVSCRHQCSVWRRVRHRTSAGYAINCMSRNTVPPICSITTVTPTTSLFWVLLPTGSVHHSGVPRHSSYSYLDLAAPGAGLLDEGAVLACLQQLLLHSGRGGKPHVSHVVPPGSLSVGPRRGKPKHGQLHGPSSLHSRCRKCMGMGGRACAPELLILLFLPAIIFLLLSPVSSINSARRSKSSVGAT